MQRWSFGTGRHGAMLVSDFEPRDAMRVMWVHVGPGRTPRATGSHVDVNVLAVRNWATGGSDGRQSHLTE